MQNQLKLETKPNLVEQRESISPYVWDLKDESASQNKMIDYYAAIEQKVHNLHSKIFVAIVWTVNKT